MRWLKVVSVFVLAAGLYTIPRVASGSTGAGVASLHDLVDVLETLKSASSAQPVAARKWKLFGHCALGMTALAGLAWFAGGDEALVPLGLTLLSGFTTSAFYLHAWQLGRAKELPPFLENDLALLRFLHSSTETTSSPLQGADAPPGTGSLNLSATNFHTSSPAIGLQVELPADLAAEKNHFLGRITISRFRKWLVSPPGFAAVERQVSDYKSELLNSGLSPAAQTSLMRRLYVDYLSSLAPQRKP